jgi:hypothetical protein
MIRVSPHLEEKLRIPDEIGRSIWLEKVELFEEFTL